MRGRRGNRWISLLSLGNVCMILIAHKICLGKKCRVWKMCLQLIHSSCWCSTKVLCSQSKEADKIKLDLQLLLNQEREIGLKHPDYPWSDDRITWHAAMWQLTLLFTCLQTEVHYQVSQNCLLDPEKKSCDWFTTEFIGPNLDTRTACTMSMQNHWMSKHWYQTRHEANAEPQLQADSLVDIHASDKQPPTAVLCIRNLLFCGNLTYKN